MMYFKTVNQISFLVTTCFSFYIFLFVMGMNRNKSPFKLTGCAFYLPFVLAVVSFFVQNTQQAAVFYLLSDFSAIAVIFSVMWVSSKKVNYNLFLLTIYFLPAIICIPVLTISSELLSVYSMNVISSLSVLFCIGILFFIKNEKGYKVLMFWGVLCSMGAFILQAVPVAIANTYPPVILKFMAYSFLALYFYRETYSHLTAKVAEAEERLTDADRTLYYEVKKRTIEIERSNERLVTISKTDAMTRALNKAALMDAIESQISSNSKERFSLIMYDIDKFKSINDTFGHIVGDKCIRKLALISKACIRDIDSLGRYGGDEFLILLPGTSLNQAKVIADRLRKKVSETESPNFTISIGISVFPEDGSTSKELIAVADEGLYHSKKKGRNSVSYKNVF